MYLIGLPPIYALNFTTPSVCFLYCVRLLSSRNKRIARQMRQENNCIRQPRPRQGEQTVASSSWPEGEKESERIKPRQNGYNCRIKKKCNKSVIEEPDCDCEHLWLGRYQSQSDAPKSDTKSRFKSSNRQSGACLLIGPNAWLYSGKSPKPSNILAAVSQSTKLQWSGLAVAGAHVNCTCVRGDWG